MNNKIKLNIALGVVLVSSGIGPWASASRLFPTPEEWANSESNKASAPAPAAAGRSAQAAAATVPSYTISQIRNSQIKPGLFETEGYVTSMASGSDNVILVNEQRYGGENAAIRVKTARNTQGLEKGGKYRFTIDAASGNVSSGVSQELKLVKFQALP